jgi:hypothetical protein
MCVSASAPLNILAKNQLAAPRCHLASSAVTKIASLREKFSYYSPQV